MSKSLFERERSKLPPEVLKGLGGSLLPDDALVWTAMSHEAREDALRRIQVLQRWESGEVGLTAAQAANEIGVSRSRFYRMARDWGDADQRSLAMLGLGVGRTEPRSRRSRNQLARAVMEHASKLVRKDPKDELSVSELTRQLIEKLNAGMFEVPGNASLRSVIVEARRRRDAADTVGLDLAFDLCACSLRSRDGLHTVAVCLDRGTGIVLGMSLADIHASLSSYRRVAADATLRIADPHKLSVPWSSRFERCEMIVGLDDTSTRKWKQETAQKFSGVNITLIDRSKRFGHYIKEHIGVGIGAIRILPTLTQEGSAAPASVSDRVFSEDEALARLAMEVRRHNDVVRGRLSKPATAVPDMIADFFASMTTKPARNG